MRVNTRGPLCPLLRKKNFATLGESVFSASFCVVFIYQEVNILWLPSVHISPPRSSVLVRTAFWSVPALAADVSFLPVVVRRVVTSWHSNALRS